MLYSTVYLPKIDADIEQLMNNCAKCIMSAKEPNKVPVHHWECSAKHYQLIHIYYAGPFMGHISLQLIYILWIEEFSVHNILT